MKLTFLTISIFAAIGVNCVSTATVKKSPQNDAHRMVQDQGSFQPCSPDSPKFTLNWSPGVIKLGETLSINFDLTPTVNLDHGTANLTIWLPDYKDPIYQVVQDFDCKVIHKVFPSTCPFRKGGTVNISGYKVYIDPSYPVPGGTFIIRGEIKNSQGQEFLCMKGTIHSESYDYDDY